MGLNINTNIPALFGRRLANQSANRLGQDLSRLASGLRINRAADDAAGLAIAEGFRTQVRALNQEINNIQTGVNLTQTADSALGAQNDAVSRIRELAVQAANGTLSDDQRSALNAEAQQLLQGIDDLAQNTEFNGQGLIDGTAGEINLEASGELQVNIDESTVDSLALNGLDISTQGGAQAAINALDSAGIQINQNRAGIGAQENRFVRAIEQREEASLNQQAAESRIRDLDVALAVIERNRDQALLQGGLSALVQSNVTASNALVLLGG